MLTVTGKQRRRKKERGQGKKMERENCVDSFRMSNIKGMFGEFGQLCFDLKLVLTVLYISHFFDIIILSSLFLSYQPLLCVPFTLSFRFMASFLYFYFIVYFILLLVVVVVGHVCVHVCSVCVHVCSVCIFLEIVGIFWQVTERYKKGCLS